MEGPSHKRRKQTTHREPDVTANEEADLTYFPAFDIPEDFWTTEAFYALDAPVAKERGWDNAQLGDKRGKPKSSCT